MWLIRMQSSGNLWRKRNLDLEIGIIGLGRDGKIVLRHLLQKTVEDLAVYDPDGRTTRHPVRNYDTAAELCDHCETVILALETASDLTALCNGIAPYLHPGQLFIDLTPASPALAHAVSNGMRRHGVRYIECGIYGREGLEQPFLLFAGGSGEAFSAALPLLRCFAPDCRHLGPAGRGKAGRLLCRALDDSLQKAVAEIGDTASMLGIGRERFLDSLGGFSGIADPLAALGGGSPVFPRELLAADTDMVSQMRQRAETLKDNE